VHSNTHQTGIGILGLGINDPTRSWSIRNYFSFVDRVVSSGRIASPKRLKDDGRHFIAAVNPGETFSYLPLALADIIMGTAGATWDDGLKRAIIPCDAASQRLVEFEFELQGPGGPVLHVQLANLITPEQSTFGG
jgi:hypothetical protein